MTKVNSYSLYACTYVASVRDISKIVCYHQVLFAAVTKSQQFGEKTTIIFAASWFHNIPCIIYCACALTTIRYLKITRNNTACSQFNHYVGLVNFPHSSSCPMFPYITFLSPRQIPIFVNQCKTFGNDPRYLAEIVCNSYRQLLC